ncbi:MAG: hypothetical protein DRN21_04720 [Thermoplasmata archaeon]|nr:MAG: hypothetical protein FE046_01980 [Thermoplasmata archaeon]RLF32653.1 MAG: hypothetical protein DRN07_04540 [Thermoplasmata archaeon]RLF38694.1 MAG: hypothetical protein DRN21_04720 [Thermoplasmata archaeon]HDN51490.1 hypothetical protein [Thermoplasmatales archaeon]
MACFLVPGTEAVVTTAVQKVIGKERAEKLKLGWLNTMLWGGVLLLAVEHIWHGEVVLWPPFLTAMNNPADIAPMVHEMVTVGAAMTIAITLAWIVLVALASILPQRIAARKEVRV